MTLQNENFRVQVVGNGTTTVFSYDFKILFDSDLAVYLDGVLQTATFSVSGVGDANGGDVTFATAPASGVKITLLRNVPKTQLIDYITAGKFPADSHETGLDLAVMRNQQVTEIDDRSVKFPVTSQTISPVLPDPDDTANHSKVLQLTATGWAFVTVAVTDIANPIVAKGDLVTHNGTDIVKLAVGVTNDDVLTVDSTAPTGQAWKTPVTAQTFPAGTLMLFQQSAAPTGWTKQGTHNDKALRVVTGAASSGGTNAYSAVFPQATTASHVITEAEMAIHTHFTTRDGAGNNNGVHLTTTSNCPENVNIPFVGAGWVNAHTAGAPGNDPSSSIGSGSGHTHPLTMDLQFVDLIIASKD